MLLQFTKATPAFVWLIFRWSCKVYAKSRVVETLLPADLGHVAEFRRQI